MKGDKQIAAKEQVICIQIAADKTQTTNAWESFNSFNKMFYYGHLNIFLLINALQEVQQESYAKMSSDDCRNPYKRSAQ